MEPGRLLVSEVIVPEVEAKEGVTVGDLASLSFDNGEFKTEIHR